MNRKIITVLLEQGIFKELYWGHFYKIDWHYACKESLQCSVGVSVLWM